MITPNRPVMTPAASMSSGNGRPVANPIRRATQPPSARSAICPSDTMPTRPTSRARPSATTEYTTTWVQICSQ